MSGRFREVVEPELIVFTAGALGEAGNLLFEILNKVTLAETEGGTSFTLRTQVLQQGSEASQYLKGHAKGWAQSIERFADLLEEIRT